MAKTIKMTIPDEFYEEIKKGAYKKGCITIQDFMKIAVRRYIETYSKRKPPKNAKD